MFQAALRRTVPTTRRGPCDFLLAPRPTGLSMTNWRLLSSFPLLPNSLHPRKQKLYTIDVSRINCSYLSLNNNLITGGYRSTSGYTSLQFQRRWFSDKQPPKEGKTQPKEGEEPGRLSGIVPSLRQRVTDFNTGDLVSMYGIFGLILLIVFSPFIVNQMRKSENMYEEIETDDPVAHAEKIYRREMMEAQLAERVLGNLIGEGDDSAGTGRPRSIDTTVDMIADVLNSESLQSALASLITRVLDSEQFQKACQTLLKNLWNDLVNDPETTAQVVQLLQNAIQNKDIQRSVKKLVMQIIDDKEVYDELTRLLVRLGQEKEVLAATQSLLTESAHNALNDPEILDHSMEFATDVVGDDIVQRTSGEALRNTVTYAVRPGLSTFLSLVGVGLLLFGLSALANARATEHESAIVEKALTTVMRNIQGTTVEGMGVLLSLPGRLLSACLSALSSIATFPLKLIQRGLSRMGRSGDATLKAITGAFEYVAGLPGALIRVAMASFGRGGKSVTESISRAVNGICGIISASFIGIGVGAVASFAKSATAALSTGLHVYTESFVALLSGTGKIMEKSTIWIDKTLESIAMTSSVAVDAAMRATETASEAVTSYVSRLVESLTNRGGNDASNGIS